MGLFDSLIDALKNGGKSSSNSSTSGIIGYGKNKADGSHDHRYNSGGDRTQAQKEGDKKKGT